MVKKGIIVALLTVWVFSLNATLLANENIDFESLFEEHQTVMLIIDPNSGTIYHANQAALDFYGYGDDLIDMRMAIINQLSAEAVDQAMQNALENNQPFFEFEHQLANGEIKDVHVYAYPVSMNGQTYLFSHVIDQTAFMASQERNRVLLTFVFVLLGLLFVTGGILLYHVWREKDTLKKARRKEQFTKDLLGYIVTNSTQAIAIHDKNLYYLYVSDEYIKQYQVKTDNIIGKHHYEVFPDLPQKWKDVHQRALKGEVITQNRDVYPKEDGTTDYTRWVCKPWYDQDGDIGGIVIYSEVINDLIETELEVKQSKEQLERVMDHSPVGMALHSFTPAVSFEYMNDNFLVIFQTTEDKLSTDNGFWTLFKNDRDEPVKDTILKDVEAKKKTRLTWENIAFTNDQGEQRFIDMYSTPLPNSSLYISTVIDVTDRKQKEDEIIHISHHDYLTGIPNRRYYQNMLTRFDYPMYYPLAIVNMDVNSLKLINDAFGHEKGNEVLKTIANILNDSKRACDFIARVGGDEFSMICSNTTEEAIITVLDDIHQTIEKHTIHDVTLSLAAGFSVKERQSQSIRSVLKKAEDNMYKHKVITGNSSRNQAIQSILQTLQNKFEEEKHHSERVSHYSRCIGEMLGLKQHEVQELEMAALYHDIGKISIPDEVLKKPGKLTNEEWKIMKNHTINGYQILRAADRYSNIASYAMSHHERMDGKGYPNGIKGDKIPLFSRIIAVCDAYEAMTSTRPYKEASTHEQAVKELKKHKDTQFDADIVDVFVNQVLQQNAKPS